MKRGYSHSQPKAIILIGPPGSGKGTQAAQLSPALSIPAISTGEMLRRECQSGSDLGKAVQAILASGQLVSDRLMNQVISARLREADCQQGFLLDGYPRTVSQARFLEGLLANLGMPDPVVFQFDISNQDVLSRLTRRLQCAECGRIFSMSTNLNGESPDSEILCDRDGSRLIHRADDNAASIRERLRLYEKNASRLVGYYKTRNCYTICAQRGPEEITNELLGIVRAHHWSAPVLRSRAKAASQASQYL
jgi:adenylate kinase